jgi:hypothetical protein
LSHFCGMTTRAFGAGTGRLSLLAGFAVTLVAGCAGPPGAAPPVPAAGPQFDGTYAGVDSLVSGAPYMCGAPSGPVTVVVRGGRFEYPFIVSPPRTSPMPVQVAADGTVSGQMQYGTEDYGPRPRYMTAWVTVTGRIAGATLQATVTDLRCVRQLAARRD